MSRGLHLALSDLEIAELLAAAEAGDDARVLELCLALEEDAGVWARACESDKAWDPISCALAPHGRARTDPVSGVVLGAVDLLSDEASGLVTHASPEEVVEIAGALTAVSDEDFRRAYDAMPTELRNPEHGDAERSYALSFLSDLRAFFAKAAGEQQHVVFTAYW